MRLLKERTILSVSSFPLKERFFSIVQGVGLNQRHARASGFETTLIFPREENELDSLLTLLSEAERNRARSSLLRVSPATGPRLGQKVGFETTLHAPIARRFLFSRNRPSWCTPFFPFWWNGAWKEAGAAGAPVARRASGACRSYAAYSLNMFRRSVQGSGPPSSASGRPHCERGFVPDCLQC
jgi:hypothetical protein